MKLLTHIGLTLFVLASLLLGGCSRERISFPPEAEGRTWFPAPNGRHGLQIIDNPHQGIQDIWYRHRYRSGLDTQIDAFHRSGSLIWSPNGKWVALNHRDYQVIHDFLLFHVGRRGSIEERPGMMDPIQRLWDRMHPEQMARLSFQVIGWSADGDRALILAAGLPLDERAPSVREAIWLEPEDRVATIAHEIPREIILNQSPFAD